MSKPKDQYPRYNYTKKRYEKAEKLLRRQRITSKRSRELSKSITNQLLSLFKSEFPNDEEDIKFLHKTIDEMIMASNVLTDEHNTVAIGHNALEVLMFKPENEFAVESWSKGDLVLLYSTHWEVADQEQPTIVETLFDINKIYLNLYHKNLI